MWRFSSNQGVVRASVVNADFGQLGVDLYLEPDTPEPVFVSLILTGERGEQASFVRRSAAEMKHHAGEIMPLMSEQQAAWAAARLGELGDIIDDLRQRARRLSEAQEERK